MRAKSKFSALANRAIFRRKKPLDFEWYSNKKTRSLNDVKISHLVSIVLCSMLMSQIGHHLLFRTYCVGLWPPVRILISFFKRFQACSFCVGIGIMHDGQKTWLFWPLIIHLVVDNFMWKLNRSINVYQRCTISIFHYQFNINYSGFLLINTNFNFNYFKEGLSISIPYQFFKKFLYQFQYQFIVSMSYYDIDKITNFLSISHCSQYQY